jgi:hypothetical protein
MNIEAMELELNKAGYFLRDDRPIREGVEAFEGRNEAYSLHTREPFQRHAVYAGSKRWAVLQACIKVFGYKTPWEVKYWRLYPDWHEKSRPYIADADGREVVTIPQHTSHPGIYDFMADLIAHQIVEAVNQVESGK